MVTKAIRRHDDEITLYELAGMLWNRRWFILVVTTVTTVAVVAASYLFEKQYQATVVVSAVSNPGSSGQIGGAAGAIASQFGGIASLAGISVGADNKKAESLAVLQSEALTEDFITQNDLLPVIYKKFWDPATKKWNINDPRKIPTLWKANQYFKTRIRGVATDTKTGLVVVSITWTDPKLAAQWANALVRLANDYLRDKAIRESERNIAYLTDEAAKTDVVGVKQAIFAILQDEINKVMLARGSIDYALKVVDPAFAPEIAASPKRLLWLGSGLAGGLGLSIFAVFLGNAWRAGSARRN